MIKLESYFVLIEDNKNLRLLLKRKERMYKTQSQAHTHTAHTPQKDTVRLKSKGKRGNDRPIRDELWNNITVLSLISFFCLWRVVILRQLLTIYKRLLKKKKKIPF